MGGSSKSSSSTGEGWATTTPGFTDELGAVLYQSLTGTSGFTKQDALTDVQGLLKQQATNALQESMPKIAAQQNQAGAYNSTTNTLLQNDLQARIAGQLAATQLDAIKTYAAADNDRIKAFSAATQASTSSASEHFEHASSASGGKFLGNLGRAVAGGVMDKVSSATGLADGGIVPKESEEEKLLKSLNLTNVANATDPSRRQQDELDEDIVEKFFKSLKGA